MFKSNRNYLKKRARTSDVLEAESILINVQVRRVAKHFEKRTGVKCVAEQNIFIRI